MRRLRFSTLTGILGSAPGAFGGCVTGSMLGLLLACTQAMAQPLPELVQAARSYDAALLAARAQAQAAEHRLRQSEGLNKGSASLSASASTGQIDLPRGATGSSNPINSSLSGRYALFNRANDVGIEQARRSQLIAQSDLDAAEQDLIIRVSQAYFDVLASQDALATSRANKTAITEQLASARRNFEVGTATITDTREAQARFDLASAQEIAAENDLRTKRIALDQLVGRTNVEPRGLSAPVSLASPTPADVEAWVSRADREHPSIRKTRLALEVARLEVDKARAAEGATLDAVSTLTMTRAGGSSPSVTAATRGITRSASVGLQLNMPLYTGGASSARISETLSLEEKARNDADVARRTVSQATRQAFFGVQSVLAQVKALEAAESSSQLALEATQLGYRVGVRVNLDVLNAQTQLFQTRRDLAKARYDAILGGLRLKQAAGGLEVRELDEVAAQLTK